MMIPCAGTDRNPPLTTRRLWSLWEMIEELRLGEILKHLHSLFNLAALGGDDKAPLRAGVRELIVQNLQELLPHCKHLDLEVPVEYIEQSLIALAAGPRPGEVSAISRSVNMIIHTIEIQSRSRAFFVLRSEAKRIYSQDRAFEQDRFAEAASEISEAAKCLALVVKI